MPVLTHISAIAAVYSGVTFRNGYRYSDTGDVSVINPIHVSDYYPGEFICEPGKVHAAEVNGPLLEKGDVLFCGKGNRVLAWTFDMDIKAVATSVFYVLKANTKMVNPKYLAYWLNRECQLGGKLSRSRQGQKVMNIPIASVCAVRIELLPLERQQLLVQCHDAWLKERALTTKLLHRREKLIEHALVQIMNSEDGKTNNLT